MTYAEILPLAEVKNYLRLEEDFTEDDTALERMVRSAIQFIEKRTNHILQLRENVQYYTTKCSDTITIFDYPVRYSGDAIVLNYSDKTVFSTNVSISVDLGYLTLEDIPSAFIDAALQMIKTWYFEAEKQSNTTLVPENVLQIINTYRRFTVC